jgi:hypothetical protein
MFSSYHSQVSSTFPILLANATWQRTHNNQQWWPIINNQNPPIETRKSTTNNNIVKDDIPSTKKHHLITATSNAYNRSSNMSLLKSFFFVCWCVGMYIPKFTFMCTYLHIQRYGGTLPLFLFIFTFIEQTYNIIYTTRRAPLLLSSLLCAR